MTPIEKYVSLKREIAQLQDELDKIRDKVFAAVDKAGGKMENEQYILSSQKRPQYKFSDTFDQLSVKLKALKKEEIENGTASVEGYTEFVTVKFRDQE